MVPAAEGAASGGSRLGGKLSGRPVFHTAIYHHVGDVLLDAIEQSLGEAFNVLRIAVHFGTSDLTCSPKASDEWMRQSATAQSALLARATRTLHRGRVVVVIVVWCGVWGGNDCEAEVAV